MTSNIGSDIISGSKRSVGFDTGAGGSSPDQELRDRLDRRLRDHLRPEFINRIDEIIVFRQLETDQLRRITAMMLDETRRRLHAQDVRLEVTPEAVDWLAERGFQPEFGARPLRRTIQRELDNRLSTMLLAADLAPGQLVTVDVADGRLTLTVSTPSPVAAH
jgi:ATP-dependent Clp protease ATP-binding subunit ClpC